MQMKAFDGTGDDKQQGVLPDEMDRAERKRLPGAPRSGKQPVCVAFAEDRLKSLGADDAGDTHENEQDLQK